MKPNPKDLLVYYGYLNSFNSGVNSWNNELVAQDMAHYDACVFGDGVANPSHPDFSNTQVILARLKVLKPDILIYGYVAVAQTIGSFQTKVNEWDALSIDGIFMDGAGYDFGVNRDGLNACIIHVRSRTYANKCFVNSWNMDHVIGTTNDVSYPNSTYNSELHESLLDSRDYYMLESFVVNTTAYSGNNGYATQSDFLIRGNKAVTLSNQSGVNLAALNVIDNANASGQALSDFCYNAAVMYGLEFSGTSDQNYAASSAAVKFWDRPKKRHIGRTNTISVVQSLIDSNICFRYGEHARVILDWTTSAQISTIEVW